MDSAWDQLLELIELIAADPSRPIGPDVEQTFAALSTQAISDRDIDSELQVPDITRWLVGMIAAHRAVRQAHPEVDEDTDLGDLLRILTRWLHPARPR